MKKQLLLILCLMLTGLIASAQTTFDDKKRSPNTTAKTAQTKKFDFSNIKVKDKSNPIGKTRSSYQMPSVFNRNGASSLYEHKVLKSSESGIPVFIESVASEAMKKSSKSQSVENIGSDYLIDIKGLLRINDPLEEFQNISKKTDDLGQTHLKMQQVYKGVKVYGGEVVVHLNKSRQVQAFNGRNKPTPELRSISPKVSFQQAISNIEIDLGKKLSNSNRAKSTGLNSILTPAASQEELVIYNVDGEAILTRHITVFPSTIDRWEYFIDANTGKVLDKYYHTCKFHTSFEDGHKEKSESIPLPPTNTSGTDLNGVNRQLNTWSDGTENFLVDISKPMFNAAQSELPDNPVGGILTIDIRDEAPAEGVQMFHVTSGSNTWNNTNGVSAHYNADVSYEYFRTTFNRNSINGQGGSIISIINVGNPDGGDFDNAFWNGTAMFYGSGDVAFSSLAGGLDVGGHEMSHGVIQNTANLEYRNQSGALNESFADIFGTMIDRDDWTLGEDIVTNVFPTGAMRDMQNPNNGGNQLGDTGWQPKDMTEFYTGSQDNGGVHINSGIPNRAYYLFATSIGKNKAELIYYRALDNYLTVSSQFIDLRLAVIKSAVDLHGEGSTEVQAAQTAFDTVGITDGEATDTDNDIPVASGDEFILSLDVNSADPNTLYVSDTNGANFVPMTTTGVLRKPSVADDGSFAIYVTEDNTVNAVTLDLNNPVESVISAEQVWAQVAISKDGTKLASILNAQENVIYISDLISGEAQAFELFNPTTSDAGATTGEVLYPDALEWDYSGEFLIYDALNRIANGDGNDIDYWDVGALKVWDNQSNSFGDGSIQKLFTNLPEGVSIGNPSFSKTSGNILAFDVFDEINNTYEVIAANIETGDVKTVYQNNRLGFPNYSKTDDKLIFDSTNNNQDDILAINMGADKITPSGNPSALIPNGKWGIWYTVGERSTLSSEKEITDFRFNVVSPAAIGVINGNQITVNLPSNINRSNLVATFASSANTSVTVVGVAQQSAVSINDFTNAVIYRVTAEDGTTKDFTVTIGTSGPVNPNDDDGDGVLNTEDQCPNTPTNSTVDASGCEIFSLPVDNFTVRSKGESCINSSNGSIEILAVADYNYTTTITGDGVNVSGDFTNAGAFLEDLDGGTYTVCITVQGQAGYENCFDVLVAEPEALSVSSKTNLTARTVTLSLSGSDLYIIQLNDEVFTTSDSEITLSLKSESTLLKVNTNKSCQGVHEETIDFGSKARVYPNPINSGDVTVQFSRTSEEKISVQLNSFDGRSIIKKTVESNEQQITLNTDGLQDGIYLLYVTINGNVETHKIIKQ